MSELTIEQLIKIILGVLVAVAVIISVSFIFKDQLFDFIKNIPTNVSGKIFLGMVK